MKFWNSYFFWASIITAYLITNALAGNVGLGIIALIVYFPIYCLVLIVCLFIDFRRLKANNQSQLDPTKRKVITAIAITVILICIFAAFNINEVIHLSQSVLKQ